MSIFLQNIQLSLTVLLSPKHNLKPDMVLYSRIHPPFLLLLLATFLLLTAFSGLKAAPPGEETSVQVAERLQHYYQQIDSLSFNFTQQTSGQISGRPKTGTGNALFVRTGSGPKMRWNYVSPDRQVIISDGQSVSMYFEKLNQMIISSVEQAQADIFLSLFESNNTISDGFNILDSDPASDTTENSGLKTIHLIPKDANSQINTIHLWISADSSLRRIELVDHFETKTIINLSDSRTNTINPDDREKLADIFTFTPPEGTEIIRQ